MTTLARLFGAITVFALIVATLTLLNVPRINAWEQAHGYPYGRMCNSVFTFHIDTCRR